MPRWGKNLARISGMERFRVEVLMQGWQPIGLIYEKEGSGEPLPSQSDQIK